MKRRLCVLLAFLAAIMLIPLAGCSQPEQDEGPEYQDAAFLSDLGRGLDARWDLIEKVQANSPDEELSSQNMTAYVQAELVAIDKYSNAAFEDSDLRELAISYINVLHDALEVAETYSVNSDVSLTKWGSLYEERTILLKDIASNYDIKVSGEHESDLNQLVSEGTAVQQTADIEAALQSIADATQFSFVDDGYGNITGTATVTNNTGTNFASVQFDVQLYDEGGVRTDTEYAFVDNWNNGETVNLDVYVTSGSMPATVKMIPSYYEIVD